VLGYEPEIGLEEGVRRMVEVSVGCCFFSVRLILLSVQWFKKENNLP